MKNPSFIPFKYALLSFILLVTGAWLAADTLSPNPFTYFSFRSVFVQYSGMLAIGAFSITMLLAARPAWLEKLMGVKNIFKWHKGFGSIAFLAALAHWWFAQGTKWLVQLGFLTRPERHPRGAAPDIATLEGFLRSIRGVMENVGEIAFYVAAALILLALIRKLPRSWFRHAHKWLALVYLPLAAHAFALFKFKYWTEPAGWLVALFLVIGVVSSLVILVKILQPSRPARLALKTD